MESISEKIQTTVTTEGYKAFAALVKEESHGGKVLLFAEEGRRGDDAQAALALMGIPVVRRNVSAEVLSDYSLLVERSIPENVMAIAGAGGAAQLDSAKALRVGRCVPRILFPLDLSGLCATDCRAFFGTKGDLLTVRSEGHRVLFDSEILSESGRAREGLGILLAQLVERIDDAFEALHLEGKTPAPALREIRSAATTLSSLREEAVCADLAKAAIRLQKAPFPLSEKDMGAAHTLALLASKSADGNYLDFLFPAAYALIRLYSQHLQAPALSPCPPPDRTKNAELLRTRCAMETRATLLKAKPYADDYRERVRLTEEYREDFAEALSEKNLPLLFLSRLYRRAKKEKEESAPLSARELLSLLSLTGEAVSGYPLLKHIKTTGLLEPLIAAS